MKHATGYTRGTDEERRLGIGYGSGHSVQETADWLGISRQAVIEIERRALKKLRKEFENRGYRFSDFF